MARKPKDLTGQRFGHWTVVGYAGLRACGKTSRRYSSWVCLCDCGPEKDFTIPERRETDYIPSGYGKDDAWMLGPQGLKGLFAENKRK